MKKISRHLWVKRGLSHLALSLVMLVLVSHAGAVSYFDGNFDSGWTTAVFGSGSYSSSASQMTTGGNPDKYFRITNYTGVSSQVYGFYMNTNATYNPSVLGAIGSIDYYEDQRYFSGDGNHQAAGVALFQDGTYYFTTRGGYTNSSTWGPLLSGIPAPFTPIDTTGLTANDFRTLASASDHPDFTSNGEAITFGFFRANSISLEEVAGIDNWQVTVNPVPLPPSALLLGSGLLGLWAVRRKYRG